jgi:hypothetical protein
MGKRGRPPIGARAMTNVERQQRHRAKRRKGRKEPLTSSVETEGDGQLPLYDFQHYAVARNWVLRFERTLEKIRRAEDSRAIGGTSGTSWEVPLVARRAAVLLSALPEALRSGYRLSGQGE